MALLDHWKPNHNIPLAHAMVHFHALPELLGPSVWAILKARRAFQNYIYVYEALVYQPTLPKCMIGGSREFIFGYYSVARRESHCRKINRERSHSDLHVLQQYLLNNLQSH